MNGIARPHLKRHLLTAAFLTAVAALLVLAVESHQASAKLTSLFESAAQQGFAPQFCSANWNVLASPNPLSHQYLRAVDALAPDDIWAVGRYYDIYGGGGPDTTFTVHWDGSTWTHFPTPGINGSGELNGVDAFGPNDVWAVGHCADCAMTSLTMHWDGVQWTRIPSPSPAGYITLHDVVAIAPNNVWAVGANDGFHSTVAMNWDGTAWSIVPTPNGGTFGDDNVLTGVAAVSANDIWAVGYIYPKGGTPTTLAIHWDGSQWTRVTTPNPGNYVRRLDGVTALAANDLWAVGQYSSNLGETYLPLFLHWDGTQWQHVTSPEFNDYNALDAVHGIAPDDVWAVGTTAACNFCPFETLTMHWDGVAWTQQASPNGFRDFSRLRGVTASSSGDVWAVGFTDEYDYPYYSDSLILRRLCPVPTPTGTPPTSTATRTRVPTYTPTATVTVAATPTCNPDGLRVLIVYADYESPPAMLRNGILSQPGIAAVDYFRADTFTPSLAQLLQYDVVVTFANVTSWADLTLLGDRLADYQDAHGIVVAFNFSWSGPPRGIGGRWQSGNYSPFENYAGNIYSTGTLGTHNASHPLMAGVSNVSAFYRANVVLKAGAEQIAAWHDGPPLIAAKGRAVGVSAYVGDEDGGWSGDFARIVVNAGRWLGPSQCGSVTPMPTSTPATPTVTHTATAVLTPTPTVTPGGPGDCTMPSFGAPANFAVGDAPERAAVGDFNHDNSLDLAVANTVSNNISVLLGNGGGFAAATNYDIGTEPSSLVVADFNRDGDPDMATSAYGLAKVMIFLGNGSGGFAPFTMYRTGTEPVGIAAADFNHDNNLDLVTANQSNYTMSVLLGNGSGGFGAPTDYDLDWIPTDIAAGDFNRDGNPDAAATNLFSDNVSVLLGNGSGGFGAATHYDVAAGPISIAVADFNNDGNPDFATSSPDTSNISVRLGNGSGGFGPLTNFPAGNGSASIGVADFNHNGVLDLAVANVPGNVAVLMGNGDGTFGPLTNFSAGSGPKAVAVGDFNRDSKVDLAVTNSNGDNVSVLLNYCGGTPTATTTLPPSTATPSRTSTRAPTITPGATATTCAVSFTDVPASHTFYAYIYCLACGGVLSGYPDGTFRPANNITRGQIAKVVSNAAGFSDPQTVQTFEDVPPGSTFFDYIGRLASRGYISGYLCGSAGEPCVPPSNLLYYRSNANATRGQISKIVSNAVGFNEPVGGQTFEDVQPGSTFYDFFERFASRGVMSGYPCGAVAEPCIPPGNRPYFRPNANATRGQTSKIVSGTFFPSCQTPSR
jgi:hypothetical protein